jgi:hypothetical protein
MVFLILGLNNGFFVLMYFSYCPLYVYMFITGQETYRAKLVDNLIS